MDFTWLLVLVIVGVVLAGMYSDYKKLGGSMTQAHEKFKTFRGTWAEIHKQFQDFAPTADIKSISFMMHIMSVGYVEGTSTVHLQDLIVDENDLDASLEDTASKIEGDVICHSLYRRDSGTMACVFLVHKT